MFKTLDINSQVFDMNEDLENAFYKGTLWNNIYEPYIYEPKELKSYSTIKEQLLNMLQVYSFASLELSLFLTTHPESKEASVALKNINVEYNKILNYFENQYYSLSNYSEINPNTFSNSFGDDRNVVI